MGVNFFSARPGDHLLMENVAGTAIYPPELFKAVVAEVYSEALAIASIREQPLTFQDAALCFRRNDGTSYVGGAKILRII